MTGDPTTERRLQRALMALRMTEDELGEEAADSLRARLSADDGAAIVRLLEGRTDDPITTGAADALARRHGGQR